MIQIFSFIVVALLALSIYIEDWTKALICFLALTFYGLFAMLFYMAKALLEVEKMKAEDELRRAQR